MAMSLRGSAQRGSVTQKERPCLHYGGNLCTGFGNEDTTCFGCGWDRADHGVSDERLRQRGYAVPAEVILYGTCPQCGHPLGSDEDLWIHGPELRHITCPQIEFSDN